MTEQNNQPEQTINQEMPLITDGQTDNLPPPPQTQEAIQQTTIPGIPGTSSSDYYTPDEFYQQFKSVFQFAGDCTGIESLPIKENEELSARATANRIYAMAEKYAFLRFMIDRRSSSVAETILMIQFLSKKATDVYAEKTGKKLGVSLWAKVRSLFRKKVKDTVYSGQVVQEKQPSQENSSAKATA